jgi:hypothetical protein
MGARFLIALAACTSAIACPARAEEAAGLAPNGPWTLDYDEDSCALRRMFGEAEDTAFLELRRFGPGLAIQAQVLNNRRTARREGHFRFRLSADGEWRTVGATLSLTYPNDFSGVIFYLQSLVNLQELEAISDPIERDAFLRSIDLDAVESAQADAIDTIALRGAFSRDLALHVGPLGEPIAALQQCVDELVTHWDIDVEAHKTLSRSALPVNLREVPRMMDYPPKMLQQGMPGLVNVRLDIDEAGGIGACHIQMPLSDPAFEASSCADIQHALEFEPALDKDGKPIASYWTTTVGFQMGR